MESLIIKRLNNVMYNTQIKESRRKLVFNENSYSIIILIHCLNEYITI